MYGEKRNAYKVLLEILTGYVGYLNFFATI